MDNELTLLIGKDEKILYAGKPDKRCFIFECIFNPLLPFALVWGLFDLFFIGAAFSSDKADEAVFFIVPFMLLHLMPVWLYLGGALLSFRRYRNTAYIVTDKAIYASGGIFGRTYKSKPFAELSHVDLHRGVFDQWFGVGDIVDVDYVLVTEEYLEMERGDHPLFRLRDQYEVLSTDGTLYLFRRIRP